MNQFIMNNDVVPFKRKLPIVVVESAYSMSPH